MKLFLRSLRLEVVSSMLAAASGLPGEQDTEVCFCRERVRLIVILFAVYVWFY
jgi:hypothetical protein